jgi:hypothetical protein
MGRPEELKRLRETGKSVRSIHELPERYTLEELREAGFTAKELDTLPEVDASELRTVGFTAEELKDAGFTARDLRHAGYRAKSLKRAGYSVRDIVRAGYHTRNLREQGFTATELAGAGKIAEDLYHGGFALPKLKEAGFGPEDIHWYGAAPWMLKKAGYTPTELKAGGIRAFTAVNTGFTLTELREGGYTASDMAESAGGWAADLYEAGFTVAEIKAADFDAEDFCDDVPECPMAELKPHFSIGEMKEGGYLAPQLKVTGGWDSPSEREEVDRIYGTDGDESLMRDAEAGQVDLDRIRRKKNEYIARAQGLYRFTLEKRQFKDDLITETLKLENTRIFSRPFQGVFTRRKTLQNLKQECRNFIQYCQENPGTNRDRNDRLIAYLQRKVKEIDDLTQEKARLEKELKQSKEDLGKLIKLRTDKINRIIDGKFKLTFSSAAQEPGLKKILGPSLSALNHDYHEAEAQVREANRELAGTCYPLKPEYSDEQRNEFLARRRTLIGDPLTSAQVKMIESPHLDDDDGLTNLNPLGRMMQLDRKIELTSWPIRELVAEKHGLDELKTLKTNVASLWTFVDRIEKSFQTFLKLGNSVTTVKRSSKWLLEKRKPKEERGHYAEHKRLTGARDIALEIGLNFGPDLLGASITVGLSVVITGTISMDDDRRLRAGIDISLQPNFKAKVGRGDTKLMELSAKLGFTVKNAKYAFVDEKHFAYYLAFRIANIYHLRRKFTAYGKHALNQYLSVYDAELKDILKAMFQDSPGKLEEMEDYLCTRPVVKAVVPRLGCPDIDFGFSSTVIPAGGGASGNLYKPVAFQRSQLVIPNGGTGGSVPATTGAQRSVDVPEFWQFEAGADGHCFFYSALFLLAMQDILTDDVHDRNGFRKVRRDAVSWWTHLYHRRRGSATWWAKWLDAPAVADLEDRKRFRTGMADGSAYAESSILAALADYWDVKFVIFVEGGEKEEIFSPDFDPDEDPVLHFGYRATSGGHYWPLLPGDDTAVPPDPAARGLETILKDGVTDPTISPDDCWQVKFAATPFEHGAAKVKKLDLGYKERRREQRAVTRENAPKLVTSRRRGFSYGASVNAEISTWIKAGLDVGYIRIVKNANPDNDGHYLNLKLKGGLLARGVSLGFNEDSEDLPDLPEDSDEEATSETYSKFASPLLGQAQIEAWVKEWWDESWDAEQEAPIDSFGVDYNRSSRYLELNFIGGGENPWRSYRLQYRRWVYTSSKSATLDIPLYVGIGLNLGIAGSKTVAISEEIGTRTLTYLETIFNGMKLRPTGKEDWKQYLDSQTKNLCDLFRRIARDPKSRAHAEALEHEELAKRTADWSESSPLSGRLDDWLSLFPGTTKGASLTESCAELAKQLLFDRQDKTLGLSENKRNNLMKLNGRLTDLLWRSTQVKARLNALEAPWKQQVLYFAPPQGRIEFTLAFHRNARIFYVEKAPYLDNQYAREFRNKKRLFEYAPHDTFDEATGQLRHSEFYQIAPDVLKNRELSEAKNALPFYEQGFEVVLKLPLSKKRTVSIRGLQPDGVGDLRKAVLDLAALAATKRYKNSNLADLKLLLQLHFALNEAFADWVEALEQDKSAKSHEEWVDAADQCMKAFLAEPDDGEAMAGNRFEEILLLIEGPFPAFVDYWDELQTR